jgi:hypothetical protein
MSTPDHRQSTIGPENGRSVAPLARQPGELQRHERKRHEEKMQVGTAGLGK